MDTEVNPNEVSQEYALLQIRQKIVFIAAGYRRVGNRNETTGELQPVTLRSCKRRTLKKGSLKGNLKNKSRKFLVSARAKVKHQFSVLKC